MEEIEIIEELVRDIHTPFGTKSGYEHERYLNNKVTYYIRLGVSVDELRLMAFKVKMQDFKRTSQYLTEPENRTKIEQHYKKKYKQKSRQQKGNPNQGGIA